MHPFWMQSSQHDPCTRNDLERASGKIFIYMHGSHDHHTAKGRHSDAVRLSLLSVVSVS